MELLISLEAIFLRGKYMDAMDSSRKYYLCTQQAAIDKERRILEGRIFFLILIIQSEHYYFLNISI